MPWRNFLGGLRAAATPGARGAGSARATPLSRPHVSLNNRLHNLNSSSLTEEGLCRVILVFCYLGWVENDFQFSTVCRLLLGLLRIWQNGLLSWAKWRYPTKVTDHQGQPLNAFQRFSFQNGFMIYQNCYVMNLPLRNSRRPQ